MNLSRTLRTGLGIGGYGLALLVVLIWFAQAKTDRSLLRSNAGRGTEEEHSSEGPRAGDPIRLRVQLAAQQREIQELRSKLASYEKRLESSTDGKLSRGAPDAPPELLELGGDGKIQLAQAARTALRLSEARASALAESTQAYFDMYADQQRRHLTVSTHTQNDVAFTIDAFPVEGRQIREGLFAVWQGYLDPDTFSQMKGKLAGEFGGEPDGFGNCRVEVRAHREPEGGFTSSEHFFSSSGEKQGGSSMGVFITDSAGPITALLYKYARLFKE